MTSIPTTFSSLRGFGIGCVIPDCRSNTADQAPPRFRRTPEASVEAARHLGWIHAPLNPGEPHVWFCPLHQRYEPASRRWVPGIRTEVAA